MRGEGGEAEYETGERSGGRIGRDESLFSGQSRDPLEKSSGSITDNFAREDRDRRKCALRGGGDDGDAKGGENEVLLDERVSSVEEFVGHRPNEKDKRMNGRHTR